MLKLVRISYPVMIIKPLIVIAIKLKIPSEDKSTVIVFKRPLTLNIAVKNETINIDISINISHESGNGCNTCGIIKPKTINNMIINNEIILKYFLNYSSPLRNV